MHRAFITYLLVLLLVAVVMGVDALLTIVYLVAGVYILARLWLARALPRLHVERRMAERAFPDDTVEVELRVENRGRLPVPWVELHERLPTSLAMPPAHREAISLSGGSARRLTYTLSPSQRGYYRIGPLTVRTGDVLGLVEHELTAAPAGQLIVYPHVVPLRSLGLPTRSPHPSRPTPVPLFDDPTRVRGVRDYEAGDPQRRIHWTASAKLGRLLVKQHEPASARDTIICLDLSRDAYPVGRRRTAPELAIVAAASIAHHVIVDEDQAAGLLTEAHDPLGEARIRFHRPPGSRRSHLAQILEVLARVRVAPVTAMHRVLGAATPDLPWGSTLVVITGTVTDDLVETLYRLRRTGFAAALVPVADDGSGEAATRRAARLGIGVHPVRRRRDLELLGGPDRRSAVAPT